MECDSQVVLSSPFSTICRLLVFHLFQSSFCITMRNRKMPSRSITLTLRPQHSPLDVPAKHEATNSGERCVCMASVTLIAFCEPVTAKRAIKKLFLRLGLWMQQTYDLKYCLTNKEKLYDVVVIMHGVTNEPKSCVDGARLFQQKKSHKATRKNLVEVFVSPMCLKLASCTFY